MRKLNVRDPNVFNEWRSLYDSFSNEEHMQFIEDCAHEFTVQRHFNAQLFDKFFSQQHEPAVMEIGGWQGELAEHCLEKHDILVWENYEICKAAIDRTMCTHPKYRAYYQSQFDWFKCKRARHYDVVVSSNTIEHLSGKHLIRLIDHIAGIKLILIEAPLIKSGETWQNYWGTHILEFTWDDIHKLFDERGYSSLWWGSDCWLYVLR